MKSTVSPKPAEIERQWFVIGGAGVFVGVLVAVGVNVGEGVRVGVFVGVGTAGSNTRTSTRWIHSSPSLTPFSLRESSLKSIPSARPLVKP